MYDTQREMSWFLTKAWWSLCARHRLGVPTTLRRSTITNQMSALKHSDLSDLEMGGTCDLFVLFEKQKLLTMVFFNL